MAASALPREPVRVGECVCVAVIVCSGSTKDITDLAWSSDGVFLCVLSLDDSAVLYNVRDDARIETLRCFKQYATGVAFDPIGRYFVTLGNERDMKVFSVEQMPESFAKKTKSKMERAEMKEMQPARLLKRVTKSLMQLTLKPSIQPKTVAVNHRTTKSNGAKKGTPPQMPPPSTASDSSPVNSSNERCEYRLFHDDQLPTFSRKPSFSPCGELLFVPTGVIEQGKCVTYTTYVFTTVSHFAKPVAVLSSPTATIACACSPVLYALHGECTPSGIREWPRHLP